MSTLHPEPPNSRSLSSLRLNPNFRTNKLWCWDEKPILVSKSLFIFYFVFYHVYFVDLGGAGAVGCLEEGVGRVN